MFKKIMDWLDKIILKYHNCEKYRKVVSIQYETYSIYDFKIITAIDYECEMCGKKLERI
jgi:hypothetical protein